MSAAASSTDAGVAAGGLQRRSSDASRRRSASVSSRRAATTAVWPNCSSRARTRGRCRSCSIDGMTRSRACCVIAPPEAALSVLHPFAPSGYHQRRSVAVVGTARSRQSRCRNPPRRPTAPSLSAAPDRPSDETPTFRPRDNFWPYADLEEEPSDEELAKLDPDLQAALYENPPGRSFSYTIVFGPFDGDRVRAGGRAGEADERLPRDRAGGPACAIARGSSPTRSRRCATSGNWSGTSTTRRCSSTTARSRTRGSCGCRCSGTCFHV